MRIAGLVAAGTGRRYGDWLQVDTGCKRRRRDQPRGLEQRCSHNNNDFFKYYANHENICNTLKVSSKRLSRQVAALAGIGRLCIKVNIILSTTVL